MGRKIKGNIVLQDGIIKEGIIEFENDVISGISESSNSSADEFFPDGWLLPGFIDIHIHGLGDGNAETAEGIKKMASFAPRTGLTSFFPTLASVTLGETINFLRDLSVFFEKKPEMAARVPGAHLEGPYIAPSHKGGMHEDLLRIPEKREAEKIIRTANGSLKLMTVSPELDGMEWLVPMLKKAGCAVSAGHTGCSYERLNRLIPLGISHVCHLFDTFDGREVEGGVTQPSLADEILLDERLSVEIIADGIHVPPTLVKLTGKAAGAERIVVITDAMQGAGLPDGTYSMPDGRKYVVRKGDVCRLENGGIVGSSLSMAEAFANLVGKFGFSAVEASKVLSGNPAAVVGCGGYLGALKKGFKADIVALNPDFEVLSCWIDGKKVFAK